ncbi:TPA: hypothetical protein U1V35_001114 [Streptococcus suis]|nr:hypothetical protein [Streptococcus suis]HEM3973526.1 hypothetical protein [Streptococcus suis]HEM3976879.1 hypothetical protein [Streptococcus suis]HEO8616985.1 hypothetical protein [Streptococcus suis]
MEQINMCFETIFNNFKHPQKLEVQNVLLITKNDGIQSLESKEWEELCWELRSELLLKKDNVVREGIGEKWNINSKYFRDTFVIPIETYLKKCSFSKLAIDTVLFDLSTILNFKVLQEEFGFDSSFHETMYQIYLSGYIPVGYEGNYPDGTFCVMTPQSEE